MICFVDLCRAAQEQNVICSLFCPIGQVGQVGQPGQNQLRPKRKLGQQFFQAEKKLVEGMSVAVVGWDGMGGEGRQLVENQI